MTYAQIEKIHIWNLINEASRNVWVTFRLIVYIRYQEIVLLPKTGFERFIAKGTQAFQLTIFM